MKSHVNKWLSILFAGILPLMPMLRAALPVARTLGSPTGSLILRVGVGVVALFGFHGVSKASSLSISPPTATIGQFYSGTVTYSGGHAGNVHGMSVSNVCGTSWSIIPGLTLTYNGGATATLSGTPSGAAGTAPLKGITVWEVAGCGGNSDNRQTTSLILVAGNSNVAPNILVPPQNIISQIGADVILSGGANGIPAPHYYWKQGLNIIPGATNSTLIIPAAQFSNAGQYTLIASNSEGQAQSVCYLSEVLSAGNNILALNYTNYVVAGTPVTMSAFITNVPAAANTYSWQYNHGNIGVTTSNLNLTAAQTAPAKSGIYTVVFNSSVGTNVLANAQSYDSYWRFGFPPVASNQLSSINASAGADATFNVVLSGSSFADVFLYQNGTNLIASTSLAGYNPSLVTNTTNVSLTLSNVSAGDSGNYTFVVTNFWGSTTSSVTALTVGTGSVPTVSNPVGQTNYAGKNIILNVTATNATTYQWLKGGVNLASSPTISGVNTNVLTFMPARTNDSGAYQIVVSNSTGSATSQVANLSIFPPPGLSAYPGTNGIQLTASGGVPGSDYVVLITSNLTTSPWLPLLTNSVPPGGIMSYTDTNSAIPGAQRFYRILFP